MNTNILFLLLFVSFLRPCQNLFAQTPQSKNLKVTFQEKEGYLSINAVDAKLSDLVYLLKNECEIELFIQDFTNDTVFNAQINRKFIDKALREAIPTRFNFTYKLKSNIDVADNDDTTKINLQPKSKLVKPDDGINKKQQLPPENIQQLTDVTNANKQIGAIEKSTNGKAKMRSTKNIKEKTNQGDQQIPKNITKSNIDTDIVKGTDYYGKMLIKITSGNIEVLSFTRVEGSIVQQEKIEGEYLYTVEVDNQTIFVNSFFDPTEDRSIFKDTDERGHHFSQNNEALINLIVPRNLLIKNEQERSRIEFYRINSELRTQNSSLFLKSKPNTQPIKTLSSTDLIKARINR